MIRMNHVIKLCVSAALSLATQVCAASAEESSNPPGKTLAPAAGAAELFKLSSNQRIACSRGLAAGKLNTATCKSYAYVFNTRTSEYYRCQVSLALTRDNKEVINV